MRKLDASEFLRPPSVNPGAAPMLQWLKITDLVVDDRYQRPIMGKGRQNVRAIIAGFNWAKFAPVVVAPVEGGLYAIIDGQHRATAAAVIGAQQVPCQVVIADLTEQAAAFKSINGQVTQMHKLALHYAALAAGDAAALEVHEAAEAGGVTICRYPVSAANMKAGETLALGALTECLKAYGRDCLVTALTCFTETDNHQPGYLAATSIKAVCAVLAANATWREGGGALLAAFDEIDMEIEAEEARITRRAKGTANWEILADRLRAALSAGFKVGKAA